MRELLKYHNCVVTLEFDDPTEEYHAFVLFREGAAKHENVDLTDPTFIGLERKLKALHRALEQVIDA